jgi:hypothetical protein
LRWQLALGRDSRWLPIDGLGSGANCFAGACVMGISARVARYSACKIAGVADGRESFLRHFEIARDRERLADRPRRAQTPQWPARAAKDPLHSRIRHGDDLRELAHQAEFDHAGEQLKRRFGRTSNQTNRRMAAIATSSSKKDMITILSNSGMVEWLANTARLPSQIGAENQSACIRVVGA